MRRSDEGVFRVVHIRAMMEPPECVLEENATQNDQPQQDVRFAKISLLEYFKGQHADYEAKSGW